MSKMEGRSGLRVAPGIFQFGTSTLKVPCAVSLNSGSRVRVVSDDAALGQTLLAWISGLGGLQSRYSYADKDDVVPRSGVLSEQEIAAVTVDGRPINTVGCDESDLARRASIAAYVFPEPKQYVLGRTVADEWRYSFSALGHKCASDDLLHLYDIGNLKHALTLNLSGGEAHRLSIACAVETGAPIIVMDLSAQNLDLAFLRNLPLLLDARCAGRTVILFGVGEDLQEYKSFDLLSIARDGTVTHGAAAFGDSPVVAPDQHFLTSQLRSRVDGLLTVRAIDIARPGVTLPTSFDICQGQIYRLTGPNGSGKTTIGKILAGRLQSSEWGGRFEHGTQAKSWSAIMTNQYPRRSLLSLHRSHSTQRSKTEPISDNGGDANDLSNLKLRAASWACSHSSEIVFLDEPTAGMRLADKSRFIALLNEYPQKSFVLATHDELLNGIGQEIRLISAA